MSKPPHKPATWLIPFIPKISYPGEEEALTAIKNICQTNKLAYTDIKTDLFGTPLKRHFPGRQSRTIPLPS